MRIVHVLTRFLRAGTEENTAITCNGQVAAGHDVWVVYGHEAQDEALSMLDPAVKRIVVPSMVHAPDLKNDVTAMLELRAIFKRVGADVVHTHQSKAGALGRLAAKLAGTPHVVHGVHIVPFMNAKPLEGMVYRTIERILAQYTDAYINVAPALREACLSAGVGTADQHFVVPSGMDIDKFRNAARPVDGDRLTSPIEGNTIPPKIVLLVSALEKRKRQFEFLATFRQVVDQVPNVRLLLAGDGPERRAIEGEVERLGLREHVWLLGLRQDVEQLIAIADLGVLTSEREGLARSVIQYALGGLPIISPDHPGSTRVITSGKNGYLTTLERLDDFIEPMVVLLTDDLLRRRMAKASLAVDLSDWGAQRMIEGIDHVYRTIGAQIPSMTSETKLGTGTR